MVEEIDSINLFRLIIKVKLDEGEFEMKVKWKMAVVCGTALTGIVLFIFQFRDVKLAKQASKYELELEDSKELKSESLKVFSFFKEGNYEAALKAMDKVNLKELSNKTIKSLVSNFHKVYTQRSVDLTLVKKCSGEANRLLDELLLRLITDKNVSKVNSLKYKKAKSLFYLGEYEGAKAIIEKVIKAQPFKPDTIKFKLLLGEIVAAQKNYVLVSKTYASLAALIIRMDLNEKDRQLQNLKIYTEWSAAYTWAVESEFYQKGLSLSQLAVKLGFDSNFESLRLHEKALY